MHLPTSCRHRFARRPCWRGSIRSSSGWCSRRSARCACWPVPAPARPGRSPAASPIRCVTGAAAGRAGARRDLHRPAAGELRTRLRQLGRRRRAGAHVSRRGAAPARLFLAAGDGRRRCRSWSAARRGSSRRPRAQRRVVAAGAGAARRHLGDRVGEGHAWSARASTPAAAARAARDLPLDAVATAGDLRGVRGGQAPGGDDRLRGSAAAHGRAHRGAPLRRRRAARPLPPFRRRRVPGRQPAAAPAARRRGSAVADSLCVVGDPEQTIYSFTGASSSYLQNFRQRHEDAEVVRLVRNYRSTPQVVALANAVITRGRIGRARCRRRRPPGPSRAG